MDLVKTIRITAPPETVYECWTKTESLSRWLGKCAKVEFRIGGNFDIIPDKNSRKKSVSPHCRLLHLQKNRCIDFEWKGPGEFAAVMDREPFTWVRVIFREDTEGTVLTLVHRGWGNTQPWEDARRWHDHAWEEILTRLKGWVEKGRNTGILEG
jgi:uncharacterized protein YndB with AHSA1/START domain